LRSRTGGVRTHGSYANTFGEIAQVARREFKRPTTFVGIFYCLRGLYCGLAGGDGLLERFKPRLRYEIRVAR
jgi:hypothetical protein